MSTELKSFYPKNLGEISLTRFYGGAENGVSLQLGQNYWEDGKYGFIQVSHQDARALGELLLRFAEAPMKFPEPAEPEDDEEEADQGSFHEEMKLLNSRLPQPD